MNIIDLISDTHLILRKQAYERWLSEGHEPVSQRESHLLSKIADTPLSISEASRKMNISRQAAQKTALLLEKKGFLLYLRKVENKKEILLKLTPTGYRYLELSEKSKLRLEMELTDMVGLKEIEDLKKVLQKICSNTV